MLLKKATGMSNDESAEERAAGERFGAWLLEVEAAPASGGGSIVQGRCAERSSDPALLRRYDQYSRVKASSSCLGPEWVAALQAAKIHDRKKH
jgi:hypothetical protein